MLALHCCVCKFSSFEEQGLPFIGMHWLLIVVASLVRRTGQDTWASLVAARSGKVEVLGDPAVVVQSPSKSCLSHCGPMECSPPGSPVHGILWEGIVERGHHSLLQGISQSRIRSPAISARFFTI